MTMNIAAHVAEYTPKGIMHGKHKVSLSGGFVKYNIIQREQVHQKEETALNTVVPEESAALYFTQSDITIGVFVCTERYRLQLACFIYSVPPPTNLKCTRKR